MRLPSVLKRYKDSDPTTHLAARSILLVSILCIAGNISNLLNNILGNGTTLAIIISGIITALLCTIPLFLNRGLLRTASNLLIFIMITEMALVVWVGSNPLYEHVNITFVALSTTILCQLFFLLSGYSIVQGIILSALQIAIVVAAHVLIGLPYADGPQGIALENRTFSDSITLMIVSQIIILISFEVRRRTVKNFTDKLQDLVDEKMQQVNDILNNIDQGLFTVNIDSSIGKEYSARANSLLQVSDVSTSSLPDLFRLDDRQNAAFESWLKLVKERHQKLHWDKLVRLSPIHALKLKSATESENATEHISITYQKILDKQGMLSKIMVLAVDETEKILRDLQLSAEREQHENEVKTILSISGTPPEELNDFLDDTATRLTRLSRECAALAEGFQHQRTHHPNAVPHALSPERINALYRDIHTIKGNGGSFGFDQLTRQAHAAEDQLEALRSNASIRRIDIMNRLQTELSALTASLADIRVKAAQIFGTNEELSVRVPETCVSAIHALCDTLDAEATPAGVQKLVAECRRLSFKTLRSLTRKHQKTAQSAARKLGKSIRFVVQDDMKILPPDALVPFDAALTHLIRNSVDHGIEANEQRSENGKGIGSITLAYTEHAGIRTLSIADDGAGINPDAVARNAVVQQLLSEAEAAALSSDEKNMLIFSPGFSTAASVSDVSGRGMGLDIVTKEINTLGGSIAVRSLPGKGTTFSISVPQVSA